MSGTPRWRRYLRLTRPNIGADVDDELEFHLAMRVERNIALGMTPEAARHDALDRFGDLGQVRHRLVSHDARRQASEGRKEYLMDFLHDLRFGLRSLRRAPGFTAAAILTLALGIGANAAIFSVVNAVVLRPLPYSRPQELVSIGTGAAGEFLALRERLHSFSQLAAWVEQTHPIDDGAMSIRVEGAAVTPNLLPMLGVSPILGRGFTAEEGQLGKNYVLLISETLWRQQFGGSSDIIGRRILVDGMPVTIIGVMPNDFHFPARTTQYWHPLAFNTANVGATWAVWDKKIIGRTAPGVTVARAAREVREVWPTLRTLNPVWDPGPEYRRDVAPVPLQQSVVGSASRLLWILFGCVLLVLLVGCVNVANLLLARATARDRELTVRAALGGGRARLVRQLVTESLLLATIGALAALPFCVAALRWLVAVMPAGIPRAEEISVSGTVLAFTAAVALCTGLLFGVVPALRATRARTMSGAGIGRRSSPDTQHHRLSAVLVTSEIAFAVVLVIAATLLVRSFNALRSVDTGFDPDQLIAARITPPAGSYSDPGRVQAFYTDMVSRLSGVSGVRSVALTDKLPMAQVVWGIALRVQGQFEDSKHTLPSVDHFQQVTPSYFSTMRIPLLRGRVFADADRAGQPPVAIVSQSIARRYWPNEDALGKRIGPPWDFPWMTIVGIVPDTKQDSLRDTTRASLYVPWAQRTIYTGSEMWVLLRTAGDPSALATTIRGVARDLDRRVAVSDVRTMESIVASSVQKTRFTVSLVAAFALAALLLGAIGIYGVMSYLVSQRTQEMGIRVALGATAAEVMRLVVGRAARLAVVGALVGIVAALIATRWLGAFLYGISGTDPITFIGVPVLFVGVAIAASYAPALRATRIDPVRALKAD